MRCVIEKINYICTFNAIANIIMRLKFIISILLASLSLYSFALDVQCSAGGLHAVVTDMNVTTLKVTGTMDANDFYFMADNLRKLTTVDLSEVKIVPCHTNQLHYSKFNFDADELPAGTFASMAVTSVMLPTGLKRIGSAAFADCQRLAQIDLPASLEVIDNYAFAGCTAMTELTLPASVVEVGIGAFMRCSALKTFAVASSGHLTRLGDMALMDCPALTNISLGNTIKSLGSRALTGTGIQALDLRGSSVLEEIGDWALTLTPITSVNLPSSLKQLGNGLFLYDKSLTSVTFGQRLAATGDYAFAGTSLQGKLTFEGLKTLGDYALYNLQSITSVEFPTITEHLGTRSMAGMTGLAELICKAQNPPTLGKEVWAGVKQSEVPLSVPKTSIDLYQSSDQWMEFLYPSQWLKGDVNNDGSVNISDINAVVSIILGASVDIETLQRADVNEDGVINITDVNLLLNIIMRPSSSVMLNVDTQDQLHLPDVNVMAGEQVTVAVSLDNAGAYSALQCDITLPQGLTLASGSCPEGYVMHSSPMDESTARIAIYSPEARHFDNDAPVFTLTLRADKSLPAESQILLSGAVIAAGFEGWHPADCAARVNSTSHVADLTVDYGRVWAEGRTLCIEVRENTTAILSTISGISRKLTLTEGVNRYELEPGIYVVVINNRSYKIAIQ